VPLRDDACIFCALVMGGRAVFMSVVNTETPLTILPQGAIPFIVVGFLITTLEAVGEGGVLALVGLVFWNGAQLQAIFSLDIASLVFWWTLSSENAG